MKNMVDVIVFGGDHHNLLGVVRSLGRKGIKPFVLLHDKSMRKEYKLLKSKYVSSYKIVPDCETGLDYLRQNQNVSEKPVIICTSDGAASIVDRNYDALKDHYHVPNCAKQGEITRIMDKAIMGQEAIKAGLCIPKSVVINKESEWNQYDIPFPCITKPLLSIGGTKEDIAICRSLKDLEVKINYSTCTKIQVQEYIDKDFEYQLIGCSLDGGKHVIIPGRSRIITQPICTNTGFLQYENLDGTEPIRECESFIKNIHYSGLFSMEFLRGKDGKNYYMETNFRNDGNSICVTAAGVNLAYIWYAFNIGSDWKKEIPAFVKELKVMPEYTELGLWYTDVISYSRLKRELKDADIFMDYADDDPAPTNGHWDYRLQMASLILKKPIRNLLRHIVV